MYVYIYIRVYPLICMYKYTCNMYINNILCPSSTNIWFGGQGWWLSQLLSCLRLAPPEELFEVLLALAVGGRLLGKETHALARKKWMQPDDI